jgi:hypothetical protein
MRCILFMFPFWSLFFPTTTRNSSRIQRGWGKKPFFSPSPTNVRAMCSLFCGSDAKLFNGLRSEGCRLVYTPCTLLKFYRRFGGRFFLHLHVLIVSHANNKKKQIASSLLCLVDTIRFFPEDGGSTRLRNMCVHLAVNKTYHCIHLRTYFDSNLNETMTQYFYVSFNSLFRVIK